MNLEQYRITFLDYLESKVQFEEPKNLYAPIHYILQIGGKRMRPILALMGAQAFGGDYREALDAAVSVEVFHNFTLLHDDIMDDAPLRRGKATVHEKWDINTAILSGDAMMILANQYLESYDTETYVRLMQLFQKTALEVCEGQQYDVDFETRNDVTIDEYIEMIRLKTSVLVGCALEMGAIVAGAKEDDAKKLYQFGVDLGIAFQLQDDYLDAYGNPETFGKQVGGDIIENKKTFLYIEALKNLDKDKSDRLYTLFNQEAKDVEVKVEEVMQLFAEANVESQIKTEIERYTLKAFKVLETIKISEESKNELVAFGNYLMKRKS